MADPVLHQLKISLPPDLVAYVQQQAARTDRTPSGVIRHWIAEQKRREPPPEAVFPTEIAPIIPAIPPTPEGIAAGKARIAKLREELQQIRLRQRMHADTAADEDRISRINLEIDVVSKAVAMVMRMLRPTNGGLNAV
jgi:hypothetical protein